MTTDLEPNLDESIEALAGNNGLLREGTVDLTDVVVRCTGRNYRQGEGEVSSRFRVRYNLALSPGRARRGRLEGLSDGRSLNQRRDKGGSGSSKSER